MYEFYTLKLRYFKIKENYKKYSYNISIYIFQESVLECIREALPNALPNQQSNKENLKWSNFLSKWNLLYIYNTSKQFRKIPSIFYRVSIIMLL